MPLTENFRQFESHMRFFCINEGYTIKSPKKLAEMMAGKARLLSDEIGKALTSDEDNRADSTLRDQMVAFKNILIHDITPKGFDNILHYQKIIVALTETDRLMKVIDSSWEV